MRGSLICDIIYIYKLGTLTNDDKILIKTLRLEKRTECINSDARISVAKMKEKYFM